MPPRVTYWTGTWDPRKEAISKEIAALRIGSRRHAPLVGFSPAHANELDLGARELRLSHRRWMALRFAAGVVEPLGDVTHVFGGRDSWHLLRAVGRRPVVLTAVVSDPPGSTPPRMDFARVVVETENERDEWLALGYPADRLAIIRPGIDLTAFCPVRRPPVHPRRLLFASTPADPHEIDARGIPLLVELARARPDIEIAVPWRQWGDVAAARQILDALCPSSNFLVRHDDVTDMRTEFAAASATIVAFDGRIGKACPNFVVEGLAMGLPCVATSESGLAPLLAASGAGVIADRSVAALSRAVDDLLAGWEVRAARARALAEREFDLSRFRARYEELYADVAGRREPA